MKADVGQRDHVRKPRIKLVAFDEITLGTGRGYLVKGLIPRTGLTVIWGPPKSGKSFWTFDIAWCSILSTARSAGPNRAIRI